MYNPFTRKTTKEGYMTLKDTQKPWIIATKYSLTVKNGCISICEKSQKSNRGKIEQRKTMSTLIKIRLEFNETW